MTGAAVGPRGAGGWAPAQASHDRAFGTGARHKTYNVLVQYAAGLSCRPCVRPGASAAPHPNSFPAHTGQGSAHQRQRAHTPRPYASKPSAAPAPACAQCVRNTSSRPAGSLPGVPSVPVSLKHNVTVSRLTKIHGKVACRSAQSCLRPYAKRTSSKEHALLRPARPAAPPCPALANRHSALVSGGPTPWSDHPDWPRGDCCEVGRDPGGSPAKV